MPRIKVNDLSKDQKINKEEMKNVFWGIITSIKSFEDPLTTKTDLKDTTIKFPGSHW